MPIYEYNCPKCGRLEVFQRITDDPLAHCPTCQRRVKKLISQSSFHLKGSGWYVTDYARKGGERAKSTGEATDSSASSTTDSSTTPSSATGSSSPPSSATPATPESKSGSASKGKNSSAGTEAG